MLDQSSAEHLGAVRRLDLAVSTRQLDSLGRALVDARLIDEAWFSEVARAASENGQSLIAHLLAEARVDPSALAECVSQVFGIPWVDLYARDLQHAPIELVDEATLREHQMLPLERRGRRLTLAIADPGNQTALDAVAFATGLQVEVVVATADTIIPAIDRALSASALSFQEFSDEPEDPEPEGPGEEAILAGDNTPDDAPVVRFVNRILADAVRMEASDIHFEPYERTFRIRFRIDGVLKSIAQPPGRIARRLAARLKVMAGLDIAERRLPQDGRIKHAMSGDRTFDFRVSTCPTLWGEKIVLRVLESARLDLGLDKLGMSASQKACYLDAIDRPYGMILVTGPTGSGKTITLYSALNALNDEGRNISTVEDPVEIRVPGINQVQHNTRQGLTFARTLRAFVRQDPDVIMVGEIRDLETAEIAIKAAQTGHLVLSTLHTNDAPQSITRLINMGVPAYNIVSALHLVMAQRLARTLHSCKVPDHAPTSQTLIEMGLDKDEAEIECYQPGHCNRCHMGYKGRTGVFQVMPVSEPMEQIILDGGCAIALTDQCRREGIADLRRSALELVKAGRTGLAEVNRITRH